MASDEQIEGSTDRCEVSEVWTLSCADLVRIYGPAEYVRIDVEGENWRCLSQLKSVDLRDRPRYISVGATNADLLRALKALGFDSFKAVNLNSVEALKWGESATGSDKSTKWYPVEEMEQMLPNLPTTDAWYALHARRNP